MQLMLSHVKQFHVVYIIKQYCHIFSRLVTNNIDSIVFGSFCI